ncbi:MAG: pal [Deltaproteobacteria bacterium]|nr:pal [Deltaproteobacteria bacterium]
MRNYKLFLVGILVLAVGLAAGCGKRALTKSEQDRLAAISAKIAEAERIGPPECLDPKLHAKAVVELAHARHEFEEAWGKEHGEEATKEAEAAAEALLKATKDCVAKRKPAEPPPSAPPSPEPPVPAPPPPAPAPAVEEKAALDPVYFDFDKSFIREDAKPALQKTADYLKKNKDAKIQVQGNCDERGTSEYNMALGDRRATSAKKYLVGLGIDGNRVTTVSYGKEKPICTDHNEECWQKNRRGDIMLQK